MSAQVAPNFTLNHVVGHPVSLGDFRGRPVVLIFGGKESSEQSRQIARTIRSRYTGEQLPMVSILDMSSVPRLVQPIARGQIGKAYQEAVKDMTADQQAAGLPVPADPSREIIMLPDWNGSVIKSFGLSGLDRQAVVVLVDGEGYIRGYGAGMQGGEQILGLFNG